MRASTLPYELIVAAAFLLFCIGAVLYVGDVSVFPYVLGGLGLVLRHLLRQPFMGLPQIPPVARANTPQLLLGALSR